MSSATAPFVNAPATGDLSDVVVIEGVRARAYCIPTESPESDGTLSWDSTTLILAEIDAAGETGIGYTYAHKACVTLIADTLAPVLVGQELGCHARLWSQMVSRVRNLGRSGLCAMAVSALDVALWDLRAKLSDLPACSLLGAARTSVPVYGSGGFTSYPTAKLQSQLAGWAAGGIPRVKMKVGREPASDPGRVEAARAAIGDAQLFVDANGAYVPKQAISMAQCFAEAGVVWFEEPVDYRDFAGLRTVRDRAPACMEISVGEYAWEARDFYDLLNAQVADVLQADATRCGGFTGFLQADALCASRHVPLSSHCAPALHAHVACAAKQLRHVEYFFDHVRIEQMLFDGVVAPVGGCLTPDLKRPGLGLEFKIADAQAYAC